MNRGIADTRFTVGEIVASGGDLYCLHLKRILPIFLVVYVPINIGLSFIPAADWAETYGDLGPRMHMAIIQLTEFFLGTLATMALAKLMEESLYGHTITWLAALRHAASRWGAAILTGLLAMLIVFGLTLLLIVPGVIWAIYYSFFLFIVALRGLSGKQALDYSRAMVKGQWWPVFTYLLVIQLLAVLAAIVVTAPFEVLPKYRLLNILSNTLSDIVSPLFLTMTIVFFLNNDYLRTWGEPANPPMNDPTGIPPSAET
ncbi:MAG: hypothetical protein NTZ17_11355 [Phycisphaerae bacterium]|nr:hypothetical protein [Phycisphaerae bacterium]